MQAHSRLILSAITIAIMLSQVHAALANGYEAAAPWPSQAEGRALPHPKWVLAIPARRSADGSLSIWERSDEWTSAWRVPETVDGLRIVTLLGDTEDRRSITSAAIDGMLVDEMQVVMRKYGAPALALVVTDGHSMAIAGYVPGYSASWSRAEVAATLTESRASALVSIGSMFSGGTAAARGAPSVSIAITAFRPNSIGGTDYRLNFTGNWEQVDGQLDVIASIQGVRIIAEQQLDEESYTVDIELEPGLPDLSALLEQYGVPGR